MLSVEGQGAAEGEESKMDSQNIEEEDDPMSGGAEGYMSFDDYEDEDEDGQAQSSQSSHGTDHKVAYLREQRGPNAHVLLCLRG